MSPKAILLWGSGGRRGPPERSTCSSAPKAGTVGARKAGACTPFLGDEGAGEDGVCSGCNPQNQTHRSATVFLPLSWGGQGIILILQSAQQLIKSRALGL